MIAIIPARGGSQRVPRKNIRPFHGHPILAYSIHTAQSTGMFNRVVVTTDDDEIASVAEEYGAEIHWRDVEAAMDHIGTQEVAARVLESFEIDNGFASVIYATAPLLQVLDVINTMHAAMEAKSFALTVGTEPLSDAGACYAGPAWMFKKRMPLISSKTVMVPLPPERVCDINTLCDWQRAEKLYEGRNHVITS